MKTRSSKDRPFAVAVTLLLLIALVGAVLDPSCHRQGEYQTGRF
jgi:hypothetical protein